MRYSTIEVRAGVQFSVARVFAAETSWSRVNRSASGPSSALASDSRQLAARHAGGFAIWDVPDAKLICNAAAGYCLGFAFRPDGSLWAGPTLWLHDLPRLRKELEAIGLGW